MFVNGKLSNGNFQYWIMVYFSKHKFEKNFLDPEESIVRGIFNVKLRFEKYFKKFDKKFWNYVKIKLIFTILFCFKEI